MYIYSLTSKPDQTECEIKWIWKIQKLESIAIKKVRGILRRKRQKET